MRCLCKLNETFDLKVKGDVGADPIWCSKCGTNLELEELGLSKELEEKLLKWANDYGEWIDWIKDELVKNGVEMEEEHNTKGRELTDCVIKELGYRYRVIFSPSSMGKSYRKKRNWL
ncbi:hypothetical protein V1502_11430 [Bacillus sp. SCS-153A]|uniref:hypothetical protein n=1 Tax=Rossellomorea sedimentorum TaxID=3115294 RepID=UPI0039061D32